ncbi:MAG: MliC family protein [Hyphomicrobiaceae bacterium]
MHFRLVLIILMLSTGSALAASPAFDCSKAEAGSIEALICNNDGLAKLDRTLADVYSSALKKAADEHPPVLKAEQRGWIRERNKCWKSDDKPRCVANAYRRRIAELQARYRLVPGRGPFEFACDGSQANRIVATFFPTDPPTLIAERGDSVSFMVLAPSASGARYEGRNESFWEHQGEARVTWGHGAPEMRCKKLP